MQTLKYTVVRYIPDQVRDEAVNLGVLAVSDIPLVVEGRFASQDDIRRRLKVLGYDGYLDGISRFVSRLTSYYVPHQQGLNDDVRTSEFYNLLVSATAEWGGIFRLTPLRPCAFQDARTAAKMLFEEFVAPRRVSQKREGRDRRVARSLIQRLVEEAWQSFGERSTVRIERNATLPGKVESHIFPVVAMNGGPLKAVDALSLEPRDQDGVRNEIRLLAWRIADVRAKHEGISFAVGVIGDKHAPTLFSDAERVLGAQSAEVVREESLPDLAAKVIAGSLR